MQTILDLILHLDKYLGLIIEQFGLFTYVILFLIVFAETGLVVTPFLPGDSLLFVAGTLAGQNYFNIVALWVTMTAAAIIGDTVNYWIGHYIGPKVFQKKNSKFLNPEYIAKTQKFFEKHGGKTIILARFIPIVRTFAPFVAGIGKMDYRTFIIYNVVGGVIWVSAFVLGGFFLGSLPIVQENFHIAIFGIIGLSLVPPVYEFIKSKREKHEPMGEVDLEQIEKTFEK